MISAGYAKVLRATRALNPGWGIARRHAAAVLPLLEQLGIPAGSVLDYGCGAGRFGEELERLAPGRYTVSGYDPGVIGRELLPPGPFDCVVATHVLEHIEPELLTGSLEEIRARARRLVYVEVPHGPANKTLTDGRNAHLIQQPPLWWFDELRAAFPNAAVSMIVAPNPVNTIFTIEP